MKIISLLAILIAVIGCQTKEESPLKVYGQKLYFDPGHTWNQLEYGMTCGISDFGITKCWGQYYLGDGNYYSEKTSPVVVQGMENATLVKALSDTACGIKDGALKCWGNNSTGMAGLGHKQPVPFPMQIIGFESGVTALELNPFKGCAIKDSGLYCWNSSSTPKLIFGLETGVTNISVGNNHSCAVKDGGLYCWGTQRSGELGNGALSGTNTYPTLVPTMEVDVSKVVVTSGNSVVNSSTCALKNSELYCWGSNDDGQIGFTDRGKHPNPTLHPISEKRIQDFNIFGKNGCAISDGDLWCWGKFLNPKGEFRWDPDEHKAPVAESTKIHAYFKGIERISGDGKNICYSTKNRLVCLGDSNNFLIGPQLEHTIMRLPEIQTWRGEIYND